MSTETIHNPDFMTTVTLSGHIRPVTSISFSPSGLTLCTGSDDATIRIWSTINGNCLRMLKCDCGWVNCCKFNESGEVIAFGGHDGKLRLYSIETDEIIAISDHVHRSDIRDVEYSPDGIHIAVASRDSTISISSIISRQIGSSPVHVLSSPTSLPLTSPELTSDFAAFEGADVLAAHARNRAVSDASFSSTQVSIDLVLESLLKGHSDSVSAVSFSRPLGLYLASGSADSTIRIWVKEEERETRTCVAVLQGHRHAITRVCFDPWCVDGGECPFLVSSSFDSTFKKWDISQYVEKDSNGKSGMIFSRRHNPGSNMMAVMDVKVPTNGHFMAYMTCSMDGTLALWSYADGTFLFRWISTGQNPHKFSLNFSSTPLLVCGFSSHDCDQIGVSCGGKNPSVKLFRNPFIVPDLMKICLLYICGRIREEKREGGGSSSDSKEGHSGTEKKDSGQWKNAVLSHLPHHLSYILLQGYDQDQAHG